MEDCVQVVQVNSWSGWGCWDCWSISSGFDSLNSVFSLKLGSYTDGLEVSDGLWGDTWEHSHDDSLLRDSIDSDIKESFISDSGQSGHSFFGSVSSFLSLFSFL